MPTKKDQDEERQARLEALMEEFRAKTEDTRAKVDQVRNRAGKALNTAKALVDDLKRPKAPKKKS